MKEWIKRRRTCPACGQYIEHTTYGGTFFQPTRHCPHCKVQVLANNRSQLFWWLAFTFFFPVIITSQFIDKSTNALFKHLALVDFALVIVLFAISRPTFRFITVRQPE